MDPNHRSFKRSDYHSILEVDGSDVGTQIEMDDDSIVSSRIRNRTVMSVICLALVSLLLYNKTVSLTMSKSSLGASFDQNKPVVGDVKSTLSFRVQREGYDAIDTTDEVFKYSFMNGAQDIIEPYATNQLIVSNIDESVYVEYTVCSTDDEEDCVSGSVSSDSEYTQPFSLACKTGSFYKISAVEYKLSNDAHMREGTSTAVCTYVRREIRSLSSDDLSTLMDAIYEIYSLNEEKGIERYGTNFHNSRYLLDFHHFNAAQQESDHIHEGVGFLMQHIKMSNIFEQSLQAINPTLTLPYWDFTIEAASGKGIQSSYIMTPETFGSLVSPRVLSWGFTYENDLILNGAIPDGRFAKLRADYNDKYADLKAGYGYMRAPWNMNPSPFISRFSMDMQIGVSLPTCTAHYGILEMDDMMDFMYNIQYDAHATTHTLAGGVYGCDKMTPLLEAGYIADETSLKQICSKWIFYLKEFYRANYITPMKTCEMSVDTIQSSSCGFSCSAETKINLRNNLKAKIGKYVPENIDDEGWNAWTDFICTGDGARIFSGDHLESASPADPSFWVIHPTLERLFHAKLMAGGFSDETWATDPVEEKVCDKAQCYLAGKGEYVYDDLCCYGHYDTDRVLDYVVGNKSNTVGQTNLEVLTSTDPRLRVYSMSYIYDQFSWDHCDENDIEDMLRALADTNSMSREQATGDISTSSDRPSGVVMSRDGKNT